MNEDAVGPPAAPHPPGLSELFLGFAVASISGFGGVLPFARRMLIDEKRWLTELQFNDSCCSRRSCPGRTSSTSRWCSARAWAARRARRWRLMGVLGPPIVVVMILGALYAAYGELAAAQRALTGHRGRPPPASSSRSRPRWRRRVFRRGAGPAPFVALAIFGAVGSAARAAAVGAAGRDAGEHPARLVVAAMKRFSNRSPDKRSEIRGQPQRGPRISLRSCRLQGMSGARR